MDDIIIFLMAIDEHTKHVEEVLKEDRHQMADSSRYTD